MPALRSKDNAEAQAERIASLVFMAARGGQIVFSALMLANDRRRYARPLLQAAVLGGIVAESAWLSRRLVRARGYDDRIGVWVDCASAAAALLITQRGLGTGGAAPWAKNVAIGAAIGAASTRRPVDTLGTVGTLCAAAVAGGLRARGRDAHVAGLALAVNDAISWAGTHVASRAYLTAHRRNARSRDEADALRVERGAAAAAQAERNRQHEQLHQVTIGVLGRIADGTDAAAAVTSARAEAARLRYALRTGGRVPQGLDRALAGVAERAAGIRVELVTAELSVELPAAVTAALRDAVRRAVEAARDLGGADRAVVRAADTNGGVTVTVRDHGCGCAPGSAYAAHLAGIAAPPGGTVAVWSEPGEGVRVTLSGGGLDDPADRGPDPFLGQAAAGDDHDAVGDDDIDAGSGAGRGLGAQHDVGVRGFDEVDLGPAGDAFQPGSQQRRSSDDAGRGTSVHGHSLPSRRRSGVGRNDPIQPLPAEQADRTLQTALLAWRATGLATGVAALFAGRARYRSRALAVAQLAVTAAESAWYARRVLRAERWDDPVAARVDAATGAAVVLLGHINLTADDRSTWINWPPWTYAANVVCGQAMGVPSAARAVAGAATVIGANATRNRCPHDAVPDAVGLAAFFAVARLFAAQTRGGAARLEQAQARAAAEGRRLAQARERSAQLRVLHDHALQTLETISGGRYTDLAAVRTQARAEAARLGGEVAGGATAPFAQRLAAVLAAHRVNLEGELPEMPRPLADAFCGATDEALTNIAKHARARSVRVTTRVSADRLHVTIADDGVGFDPAARRAGFGLRESVIGRMREAGGDAVVDSAPGAGTRLTLSGPA